MNLIFAITFQIGYFLTLVKIIKERKEIRKSPLIPLIWGIFILGILANAITLYELYIYFTTGAEIEFFLGGMLLNIVVLQMNTRNIKNSNK